MHMSANKSGIFDDFINLSDRFLGVWYSNLYLNQPATIGQLNVSYNIGRNEVKHVTSSGNNTAESVPTLACPTDQLDDPNGG